MYLSITTTTALPPSAYEGFGQPDQPQLIHFAAVIHADNGLELDRFVTLVRPIGYPDLPEEDNMFGLVTFVAATKRGLAAEEVLHWFYSRAKLANLVIGHDLHQDLENLSTTAALLKQRWYRPRWIFSTMYGSLAAGIVHPRTIPKRGDPTTSLQPTLAECYEKAMGEPLDGALGIRSDVQAIWKVFRHIRLHLTTNQP
jgi:hypothetical protein